MNNSKQSFHGKSYIFDYNGFVARDTFTSDEVIFEVLTGPAKGIKGKAAYKAQNVGEGKFLISWQEEDGGTVVHLDDFISGTSHSHYTDKDHNFFVMAGTLTEVA
ncbi:hypothetical protein KJY74_16130 [Klebsiella pneumoniae subsp. pneumoniae]|uniref:MoaF-related domain-containing protein n=1 Tax=Klebsiella TaxID=570 RepID=UPI000F4F85F6|nr:MULTISPECIES: adenylate cyclase [Klebsiella]AYW18971.1 adenylate cyclase [Klebsiella sp. P1CD1]MCT6793363.1 hypothetical protein [Klebsiella pneumoniae subsp. pneumoniae]